MEGGELFQRIQDRQDEGPFTERGNNLMKHYSVCSDVCSHQRKNKITQFSPSLFLVRLFRVAVSRRLCTRQNSTTHRGSSNYA